MTSQEIFAQIKKKASFLCVGLDPDPQRIPKHLLKEKDPVLTFNKIIIDHTIDHAVAYKPNLAFYEAMGPAGLETLAKTLEYLPEEVFTIADAKRGDIGNTSRLYAKAFFEQMNFDAITVAPYMGEDSVGPFLAFDGKWVILLALTSNQGSQDFQLIENKEGKPLYASVLEKSKTWGTTENMMYVVGATRGESIAEVRKLVPEHFLLVPGVGAQGGSLEEVAKYGMNNQCGLLVNSSRGILYASAEKDFGEAAKKEALALQTDMAQLLDSYCK
ncbi:orotidine-5'-phosphate decarboxylase [Cyclobacterium qasimii]|uniref:Orotidine 5'-phosphate decarboxylase n=2 Tax=Cyclobacterium qasimii TaxID=1350429 RepID=S7WNT3_9BACT|nr:orotidine-5'-phosphate decarboxylase [Cyclobacterium qasimii]EPR65818.1 Orotidine 5'-phosphate decarboxylase [Cyclobacterium qasimii M12-11B]GEO23255.1 orotidine 5'-phosphate decarboxylase [Cyclobacterium qasimii]